jgi:excinuclease UvrABC nuclease subunit
MITDPPWQTLDLATASKLDEPDRNGKAVYFLWRDDVEANEAELLYIGASCNVNERVIRQGQFRDYGKFTTSAHWQAKPMIPFNRATVLWCRTVEEMAAIEKKLIRRFDPPYNTRWDDGAQVWETHIAYERKDAEDERLASKTSPERSSPK